MQFLKTLPRAKAGWGADSPRYDTQEYSPNPLGLRPSCPFPSREEMKIRGWRDNGHDGVEGLKGVATDDHTHPPLCTRPAPPSLHWASLLTPSFARDEGKGPVVFAAASLKDALDNINAAWTKDGKKPAVISYAASSVLAKQIEQAAPADVFISADLDWMEYLAEKNLIKPDTRVNLLGNTLVLIAPKDSTLQAKITPGFDLAAMIGDGKIAMGNTNSVAGRQIRQSGTDQARRVEQREGQGGAGRECARGARARLARRGAAWHRLCDRREGRPEREGARHRPGRTRIRGSSIPPRYWPRRPAPRHWRSWNISSRRPPRSCSRIRASRFSPRCPRSRRRNRSPGLRHVRRSWQRVQLAC